MITVPPVNWPALLPYLVIGGGGLVVMLVDAFVRTLRKDHLTALTGLVFLGAAIAMIAVKPEPGPQLGGMLTVQMYTRFFDFLLLGIGLVTTVYGSAVYSQDGDYRPEFYPLVLFAVLGMMVLVAASDLLILFLGIETMSLAVYALVCGRRGELRSSEAALKYLLLGSFASAFLLMGAALLYGCAGGTSYAALAAVGGTGEGGPLFAVGLGLVLVGFAFKVAMVPFHMWTPDVYDGAPAHVTGFMATAVKAAAFGALIRFVTIALPGLAAHWSGLLTVLTVLTMTAGNLLALVQASIKRMLAYSSIAHAGYLLLGVLAILAPAGGDPGRPLRESAVVQAAGSGLLFYLLGYCLMNLAAFGVISQLGRSGGVEADQVDHYRGLSGRQPVAAAVLAVAMFSLAGIPGTVGFLGKFYLFEAAIRAQLVPLAIWGVVNSLLSVYYYLRVVVVMYMSDDQTEPFDGRNWETILLAGCLAALVVLLGVFPAAVHGLTSLAFGTMLG
ncbi:MAG TPA: NADH-quinone oxidoreductase subunit N [Candidatus Krumholzibacteria bacterium]|nr:NADH-quinone oxidoreductase subunit N [Candidatus Krumholzibacteria bacterium]HPD71425.1 NADH-quinone oxidoreductase subunit N [Candidatus Krumholzibacteria bacterium]HRY41642.1 NADH-quinone oxidoreductase subunit N [Candidatus Krumholzibacteria bacterium]